MVCPQDYEHRHPQDFLRVQPEQISVPWARPEVEPDTFLGTTCTLFTSQGVADYGTADCARAGMNFNTGTFDEWTNYFYEDLDNAIAGIAIAGLAVAGTAFSLSPTR